MKTGAAILGILGGAIALIIGVVSLITAIPIGIGALLAFIGSATAQKSAAA